MKIKPIKEEMKSKMKLHIYNNDYQHISFDLKIALDSLHMCQDI